MRIDVFVHLNRLFCATVLGNFFFVHEYPSPFSETISFDSRTSK